MSDGIVIAGGGLAAQRCVETLRAKGHSGPIRVVCSERHAPYDRPPLSKELLTGELPPAAVALRPRAWYEERGIDLLLATRATRADIAGGRLELSRGRPLRYEKLLVATGSRARTLPLVEGYANVSVLRSLDDALLLRRALSHGGPLVVVGGGFIGLEAAAAARALGVKVTIVEALETPLAAVLGTQVGRWFADLHRAEGVEVLTSAQVVRAHGRSRVTALELADGRRLACGWVLVGVGVEPDTGWLASAGLDDRGVCTDPCGRSAAPGIFAAGDAARVWDPAEGRHMRTDHWEAAARAGAAAARAMLDLEPAPPFVPSFWSDQYGTRIQYVGRRENADRAELDGDPAARDFEMTFTRMGTPVAALLVGRPRGLGTFGPSAGP